MYYVHNRHATESTKYGWSNPNLELKCIYTLTVVHSLNSSLLFCGAGTEVQCFFLHCRFCYWHRSSVHLSAVSRLGALCEWVITTISIFSLSRIRPLHTHNLTCYTHVWESSAKRHEGVSNYHTLFVPSSVKSRAQNLAENAPYKVSSMFIPTLSQQAGSWEFILVTVVTSKLINTSNLQSL